MQTTSSAFVHPDSLAAEGFIPFEMNGQRFFSSYASSGSPLAETWFAYYRNPDTKPEALTYVARREKGHILILGDPAPHAYNPNGGALGKPGNDSLGWLFSTTETELQRALDAILPGEKIDPANVARCRTCGQVAAK